MDFNAIVENIKICLLQKYADFSGRAGRAEYWSFALPVWIINGLLNLIGRGSGFFGILAWVFSLAVLVPSLAAAWRRLHDIGKKGTWYLICLIPVVGWILLIVWLCQPSQPSENEFGPSPMP